MYVDVYIRQLALPMSVRLFTFSAFISFLLRFEYFLKLFIQAPWYIFAVSKLLLSLSCEFFILDVIFFISRSSTEF